METRTVLIAEPSEDITLELTRHLSPEFRVLCCGDGTGILELLDREEPALLILELSLKRMDGITLLRQLDNRESRPMVLVYTAVNTDYILCALQELPVDYLLRKPTPIPDVAERAREMLQSCAQPPVYWQVSDLLIRLGIPEHSQGFRNMIVLITLLAENPDQFLGKTLYQETAHRNRVTYESVEKAIRDAIHTGWDKGSRKLWQQYFPGAAEAPQNKPFLIRIARILCRMRQCG